jgi:hypothetical protein
MNSLSPYLNSETIQDPESLASSVYIQEYSPKSFVVRDETDTHGDALEKLGGKWNRFLREKESGVVFAGWIFYIGKRSQLDDWLNNILQK